MEDASQEEKQNFLREKILEKGYDTNQFVQFLIDKKGENGADVAVWTMVDLKKVVKEFIKLNGGEVEEDEPPKPEPKQGAKKISMFDILGQAKPKAQPQPQPQKPKVETPKPQPKIETKPQSQQNNEQTNKSETTTNAHSTTQTNTNNMTASNRSSSYSFTGNESQ